MDPLDLAIQGAVAAGTLGLAVVTVTQSRAALSRELSDAIYAPLSKQVKELLSPSGVYRGSMEAWKRLKSEHPFLTHRIPRHLYEDLDTLERIVAEVHGGLVGRTGNLIRDASRRRGEELAERAGLPQRGEVDLWLRGSVVGPYRLDIGALWVDGQDVEAWAGAEADRALDREWFLEVLVQGQRASRHTQDAVELVRGLFAEMEADEVTRTLREKARAGSELATRVNAGLEKELWRRLALGRFAV